MARRRDAFTLIELLIVVVILAILAATIIPQFTDATADTKRSTGLMNLRTLRAQIEMYKAQHNGSPPATLTKLTEKTDVSGASGTDFGPYLQFIPVNPFTNKNTVTAATSNPPAAATSGSDRGWLYHAATGNVWLDEAGYLTQ
jgi:prepilin-type N-terminal cleavage/methylation domain-containing protein